MYPVLGSAPPAKLYLDRLQAERDKRVARRKMRRVDREREKVLAEMAAQPAGVDAPPAAGVDAMGVARGMCERCNACEGYAAPRLFDAVNNHLALFCAACGCGSQHHPPQLCPDREP